MAFLVTPAAPTWPKPSTAARPEEKLVPPLTACEQCSSEETDSHTVYRGMTAKGGKVKRLPQEVTSKLGPEQQKFQSGKSMCRIGGKLWVGLTLILWGRVSIPV